MKMREARKDGRDENNRGNSSFQSGESINGSPQVVGQYLMYPRLEYQLGHSTVARMDDKSDKLSPKKPLFYIASSKTWHNNLQLSNVIYPTPTPRGKQLTNEPT